MEKIIKLVSKDTGISQEIVEAVIKLLDEGNTVPFISRYRKEVTGGLDDEALRNFEERLKYIKGIEERKEEVIRLIDEQGKLTDELKAEIEAAVVLQRVEDLYRPYKQKKRTRGVMAREKGLEPLAAFIVSKGLEVQEPVKPELGTILEIAELFIDEEKGVESGDDAIKGAMDIIAEDLSDRADIREYIRNVFIKSGVVTSKATDEEAQSVYELYYDFSEGVSKIANHRVLALDRGEKEKFLKVSIEAPGEVICSDIISKMNAAVDESSLGFEEIIREAVNDSYKRLIQPSVENEVRGLLTERAGEEAIKVFAKNTKPLFMQPPVKNVRVLAIDPGFRTGCKMAVLDETGKIITHSLFYLHHDEDKNIKLLTKLANEYDIDIISIGNGTASRETEQLITNMLKEFKREKPLYYTIVSEAGASVYSASKLATEEYPDLDVTVRGAISIGRRLQDPLAELVKIDPKSIGVGQYQHDVNQKQLSETLKVVVEDCVNSVGVDLNTATPSLLGYVSGISARVAKNIVIYRDENGKFKSRKELKKVKMLGDKAFEQSAGFLRITDGEDPLDSTAVHPESYGVAKQILLLLGYDGEGIRGGGLKEIDEKLLEWYEGVKPAETKKAQSSKPAKTLNSLSALSQLADMNKPKPKTDKSKEINDAVKMLAMELGAGEPTVRDIMGELKKPGRDPREDMPKPILRSDVLSLEDLYDGMILTGTVRNVVDFGAFVDIGVKNDGLVHISELSNKRVASPYDVVSVGDIVEVMVIKVDKDRGKVGLSMKRVK